MAQVLRELGYLVSSLRHVGGPADLLAVSTHAKYRFAVGDDITYEVQQWAKQDRPLLVEVKGTTQVPWNDYKGFGPLRRAEMIEAGVKWNVEPMLAWWPPSLRGGPMWLPVEDWPA